MGLILRMLRYETIDARRITHGSSLIRRIPLTLVLRNTCTVLRRHIPPEVMGIINTHLTLLALNTRQLNSTLIREIIIRITRSGRK